MILKVDPNQEVRQGQQVQNINSANSDNKIIGDYLLGKTIGKGTFGKVKLATHIPTQEQVAVKILEKNMMFNSSDLESVESEINILKSVLHPNISQLYQIIETNSCLYLMMEYASNGELFDYIVRKRRLTNHEACLVLAQILNALEYLHEMDISHRDLKPENLLFDKNYELKLVDFGLSKKNTGGSEQHLFTCCGSPCYASPETISSQPYIGKYVDLWSVGIILFAMVCGFLPFDDDNQTALFEKIISCEYYIPSEITSDVAEVIRGLLVKEPKNRMSIQDIKNSQFYQKYINGQMVHQGIRIGRESIQIDLLIVSIMEEQGIDRKIIIESVATNSKNSVSATYYLLKQKVERLQIQINLDQNISKISNDAPQMQNDPQQLINSKKDEYLSRYSQNNNILDEEKNKEYNEQIKNNNNQIQQTDKLSNGRNQKIKKQVKQKVILHGISHLKLMSRYCCNNDEMVSTPSNLKSKVVQRVVKTDNQNPIEKQELQSESQNVINSQEMNVLSRSSSEETEEDKYFDQDQHQSDESLSSSEKTISQIQTIPHILLKKISLNETRSKFREVQIKRLIDKILHQQSAFSKDSNLLKRQSLPNFSILSADQFNKMEQKPQSTQRIISPKNIINSTNPATDLPEQETTPQLCSSSKYQQLPAKFPSEKLIKLPSEKKISGIQKRTFGSQKKKLHILSKQSEITQLLDASSSITHMDSSQSSQQNYKITEKCNSQQNNQFFLSSALATASSTSEFQSHYDVGQYPNCEDISLTTSLNINGQSGISYPQLTDNNMSILELQDCVIDCSTPFLISNEFNSIQPCEELLLSQQNPFSPYCLQDSIQQTGRSSTQGQNKEINNNENCSQHQNKLNPQSDKQINPNSINSYRFSSRHHSKGRNSQLESNEQEKSINYQISNINQIIQASVKPENYHNRKTYQMTRSREEQSQDQQKINNQEKSLLKESNKSCTHQDSSKQLRRMILLFGNEPTSNKNISNKNSLNQKTQSVVLKSYNSSKRNSSKIDETTLKQEGLQKIPKIDEMVGMHLKRHSSAGETNYSNLIRRIKQEIILTQQTPSPKRPINTEYPYLNSPQSMSIPLVPSPINSKSELKRNLFTSQNMINHLALGSRSSNLKKSLDSSGVSSPKTVQNKNQKQFFLGSSFFHSKPVLNLNQENSDRYKNGSIIKSMISSPINQNLKLISAKIPSQNNQIYNIKQSCSKDQVLASQQNATENTFEAAAKSYIQLQKKLVYPAFGVSPISQLRIESPKNSPMHQQKIPQNLEIEQLGKQKNYKKLSSDLQITNKLQQMKNIGKLNQFATMNLLSSDSKPKQPTDQLKEIKI